MKKKLTPKGMRRTFNDLMRRAKVEAIVTKSISGHQTDRMREHYSTVSPDEQRQSIRNVVKLFGPRQSGEGSGEGTLASGEGKQKAARRLSAKGLISRAFLVGAIGFEPTTPTVSTRFGP